MQYARLLRRRQVKISKSALYQYRAEFNEHGLSGLVPRWGGGRRRRIPGPDRALLEDLCRGTNTYRNYQLLHKGAGLPGRPMSRSTVQRLAKEFSEQIAPNVRQRATQRRPSGDSKN